MTFMYDGIVYTLDEVKRDYIDLCRECSHYGETEPTWEDFTAEYTIIEN